MGTSHLKRLQILLFLSVATFLAMGCSLMSRGIGLVGQDRIKAFGPFSKQTRSVPDFEKVEAGQVFDVDISFGPHPSVTLEAPKNLLPHLTTNVSNGQLSLGSDIQYSMTKNDKVKAHVVVSHLKGVSISGAGRMVVRGSVSEPNFSAEASGASTLSLSANVTNFKLDLDGAAKATIGSLNAQSLDLQASGAADLTIKGRVGTSKIEADGAANIRGKSLTIDRADVQSSGAANVDLRVVSDLKADASGASNIRYTGNPKTRRDTSGVANIRNEG